MLLVMDVGNSHTVIGLYEDDTLRSHWRMVTTNYRTADELRILFTMWLQQEGVRLDAITGACISSVVPQMNDSLQKMCRRGFGFDPIMVEPGIKTGLQLQTENPKEVGADRIVNAVAALEEHEGPLIIVDFGTATTFDYITKQREYKGGVILPGVQVAADALFERCAKLPRVEISVPESVIGRNTVSSIRSGLTYGYGDMVSGIVGRMKKEMNESPKVIATGGLAGVIAEVAQCFDVIDPLLALKGLAVVYRKNQEAQV